jgi:TonB-linked SusC/RagA family outer membrane protein
MGRLNYNYNDKYLLTATMRADGSSKFGSDNKFGYFPSLAAAWNVHNESFFPKNFIVNSLKIRAGFGITGNQAMPPYRTLDRLGSNIYWMDGSWVTGYGPGIQYAADSQSRKFYEGLANSGLKWESTSQGNIGTDIQLLKGRIQITADYYNKKTINLLRLVDVAISSGYHKQWQNDGEVTNKGVEFSVDADIIRKVDFSWNVGLNISHNKNVVVNYDYHSATVDGVTYIVPSGNNGTEFEYFRGQTNYLTNGQPMNFFFGYKTDGIVQTRAEGLAAGLTGAMANPGEIKYVDTNNNGQIDAYDRVNLGSPDPNFFYGFNTSIRYKRFDLSGSFTGSYGNKIVNFQKLNQGSSQLQRWSVDNPTNEFPSLNSGRSVMFSDFFIEDGSYLKVQNVSLEYNIDVTKVKFIKSLSINLNCENVWTFTKFSGYDPEVGLDGLYGGSGYPRPRTISTGLNIQF